MRRTNTDETCGSQLRNILQVQPDELVVFERYSDSAASYVTLESDKPQVYKTLFRAAKAKLKLRLKATIPGDQFELPIQAPPTSSVGHMLPDLPSFHRLSAETLTLQGNTAIAPVIARTPGACPAAPKSEPVSPVSPLKAVDNEDEAPVPRSFTARESMYHETIHMTVH